MSMRALPAGEVPVATVAVARAAFPGGCLAMRLRDELGPVFQNTDFHDALVRRGGPSIPPGILALVSVLQFAERLTDRQAADAVRGRIDWMYALGLPLADPGFDFSVLSGVSRPADRRRDGPRRLGRDPGALRRTGAAAGGRGGSAPTPPMCWPACGT